MDHYVWRILLVDDDQDEYVLTRDMLSSARLGSFTLEWAGSYEKGIQALADDKFDAVLVDYQLGEHTGLELIRQAIADKYPAPFLLLTGHSTYDLDLEAMRTGVSDFLSKGEMTPALLERSVRYAIERWRAAEDLRRSRSRTQVLFDSGLIGTLVATADGCILEANDAFLRMTGWSREELAAGQLLWTEMTPPEYLEQDRKSIAEAYAQGACTPYEKEFVRKDGSRLPILLGFSWLADTPQDFVCFVVDQTERKANLERLRQSEERFRLSSQAVTGILYDWDLRSNQIYCSEGVKRVLGVDPPQSDQALAWFHQVVHPEDYEVLVRRLGEEISSQSSVLEAEYRMRHQDGSTVYVWDRAQIIRDEQGLPWRVVGTSTDISKRKMAEQALAESEARQRAVFENAPMGIFMKDRAGRYTMVNDWVLALKGLKREDVLGHTDGEQFDPEKTHKYLQVDELVWETGQPHTEENTVQTIFGERIFQVVKFLVPGPDGRPGGLCGLVEDVTERKRSEQNARFLARLGDLLLNELDEQTVFRTVSYELGVDLNADAVTLVEQDPELGQVTFHAVYNRMEDGFATFTEARDYYPPELLEPLARGETLVLDDLTADPALSALVESRGGLPETAALIAIPRLRAGELAGSILVWSASPRRWRADEVEVARSAADLGWLAVENARSRRRLQAAEKRFQVALSGSPITVFTMDRDLRYTWIHNPHSSSQKDVVGLRDDEWLDAESSATVTRIKQAVIESGESARSEVNIRINGQPVSYLMNIEPLRDPQGEVIGLTAAAMDVTDLRRLQAERDEHQAQSKLRRLLMEHREQERVEIAREIHDGPLQEMIAANMGLSEAIEISEREERISKLRWVQDSIRRQMQELRVFCNELRPPTLAPFGLEKAIRSHIDGFRGQHPELRIRLDLQPDGQLLAEEMRLALYRIYQELLNNVVKHAHASEVRVALTVGEQEIELSVTDNGLGFQMPDDWRDLAVSGHLGLVGIRERVDLLGGHVQLESAPGQGTMVWASVPREG